MKKSSTKLKVNGARIFESEAHQDDRGFFMESFRSTEFHGIDFPSFFVQDNISFSKRGTFRGLHIQRNNPQGKLVRCLEGLIIDYFIDLRPGSPSFKQIEKVTLGDPRKALWIPPGCAHGFFAVTDALVVYKCSTLYDKASDTGVNYKSKGIALEFPYVLEHISPKDLKLPSLLDYLNKSE